MSRPTLRIRRLRVLLPPRLRATAAADAGAIARAAAAAVDRNVPADPVARGGVVELPAIHVQGGNRSVAALAHDVAGQVGSATRGRRGA